jgi:hypothetical protein
MSGWSIFWWLLDHWWLFVWIGAAGGAYIAGGWRLVAVVASFGLAARLYTKGRADGAKTVAQRNLQRRKILQEKYDEIDNRPRDRDDAYRRLLDRARDE